MTISGRKFVRLPPLQTSEGNENEITLETKTAAMLSVVIGTSFEVLRYDQLRKSYKVAPSDTKQIELKKVQAILEVKLTCENDRLKSQLERIEHESLHSNKGLSLATGLKNVPEKNMVVKKPNYIRALRSEFDI